MTKTPKWRPSQEQRRFIKRYSDALTAGDAALFAGAGLSREAGFVDWRALLKDIASDLKLDIDRETDLIAVAQYHLNEKRNRARITQTIVDELARNQTPTRNHATLARLPIATVWTTNYDRLLEKAFENAGKNVDVILTKENFATSRRGRDVALYKMHGCVSQPHDAVITKDDYEQYEQKRPLFVESLKGDLIAETFLFLGFSFTDPNIDYILSRVRVLLGSSVREHFCVMRWPGRPKKNTAKSKAEFEYEKRRLTLRQSDLLRFGIETVWIDEFSDLGSLLDLLSAHIHRRSVFVSGAAFNHAPLGRDRLEDLGRGLGMRLIADGYNVVSGFGFGLGEHCVIGALRGLYGIPKGADTERLLVRPFPRATDGDQQRLNTVHREELIARSGTVIVLSGNRQRPGTGEEISPGVLEEVEIARRSGKYVIPIGASGYAAQQVWERVSKHPGEYLPGLSASSELNVLGSPASTNEELLNAVFAILEKISQVSVV